MKLRGGNELYDGTQMWSLNSLLRVKIIARNQSNCYDKCKIMHGSKNFETIVKQLVAEEACIIKIQSAENWELKIQTLQKI